MIYTTHDIVKALHIIENTCIYYQECVTCAACPYYNDANSCCTFLKFAPYQWNITKENPWRAFVHKED